MAHVIVMVVILFFIDVLVTRLNKLYFRKGSKVNCRIKHDVGATNISKNNYYSDKQQVINKLKNCTIFYCNKVIIPQPICTYICNILKRIGDFRDPNLNYGVCESCSEVSLKFSIENKTFADGKNLLVISSGMISLCPNCKNCGGLRFREINNPEEIREFTMKQSLKDEQLQKSLKKFALKSLQKKIDIEKANKNNFIIGTFMDCLMGSIKKGLVTFDNHKFERILKLLDEAPTSHTTYIYIEYYEEGYLIRATKVNSKNSDCFDWIDLK